MGLVLIKEFSFWFSSCEKDFGENFVFVGFDFGETVSNLVKQHWLGYTTFDLVKGFLTKRVTYGKKCFHLGSKNLIVVNRFP